MLRSAPRLASEVTTSVWPHWAAVNTALNLAYNNVNIQHVIGGNPLKSGPVMYEFSLVLVYHVIRLPIIRSVLYIPAMSSHQLPAHPSMTILSCQEQRRQPRQPGPASVPDNTRLMKLVKLEFKPKAKAQSPESISLNRNNLPEHRTVIYRGGRHPQTRLHSGARSVI